MATRRNIKGVLSNFLGTYMSRYSDFDGYWLFGFIVKEIGELHIDLLRPISKDPNTPLGVAIESAATKFDDQRRKAGMVPSQVEGAWLTIRKVPASVEGQINGRACHGFRVSFKASALLDDGSRYERERIEFIAAHNPAFELRSARRATPTV